MVKLLGVMVGTTASSWSGAPWFGLRKRLSAANPHVSQHPALAEAFNRALKEMGIDWATVASVRARPNPTDESDPSYTIALQIDGERPVHKAIETKWSAG